MNRTETVGGSIENYYRLHAGIYDLTRWTFLFDRRHIVRRAAGMLRPARILEIGCGTGHNLHLLRRLFPAAQIHGLDLSGTMLSIARRRLDDSVNLWECAYDRPLTAVSRQRGYDLILASYALSMFNPGWENAIDNMEEDLMPGGSIAVVDFHDTRSQLFADWMMMNHVRMQGHLLERLDERFQPQLRDLRKAYTGLWRYCLYLGTQR